jgi:diguanylate cyclase (GGDEF)-like protein
MEQAHAVLTAAPDPDLMGAQEPDWAAMQPILSSLSRYHGLPYCTQGCPRMDSNSPNMDLSQALARLESTLVELKDCQARLETSEAQLDEMNKLVFEQSATDALTGTKNRVAYDRIMNQQSARSGRSHAFLSVVMVDVDRCGAYNEEFGRIGGDDILQRVAQVLKSHARAYDYVARYNSDEFAVVLPDTPAQAAMIVAERARTSINSVSWRHRPMTVSIGIATSAPAGKSDSTGHSVTARALAALAAAKAKGGDCCVADNAP